MSALNEATDDSIIDLENHRNIVVGRKRRCSNGPSSQRDSQIKAEKNATRTVEMATPPATPHRTKKRVRFSEVGSSSSTTGLTPFFCRNSISSPPPSKSRRASTPSSRLKLAVDDTPIISGILQWGPYRQGLTGRAKRALRRRGLSEELHKIELEGRLEEKSRQTEIERLKPEIQELRDQQGLTSQTGGEAGIEPPDTSDDSRKIKDLELQISELRAKSQRPSLDPTAYNDIDLTMIIAQDPFREDPSIMPTYDDDFNVDMTEVHTSTPSRGTFLSPPATMPNTPSRSVIDPDSTGEDQGVKDQRIHVENQLKELQDELRKNLEVTNTAHERLTAKLSPFMDESVALSEENDSLDAALDSVLTQLALAQSSALESASCLSALTNEVVTLFPLSPQGPESTLKAIQDRFRTARLDFEYLTPGENPEGFDNMKLLEMLISRLRLLTKKVTQQETDIDQYHAQEMSLRQQLGSRIDAQTVLQDEIKCMKSDIQDRDDSISKLGQALQGYRNEVTELESFITRLEVDHAIDMEKEKKAYESRILDSELQMDILQATAEGREMIMAELEGRLSAALTSSEGLKEEMARIVEKGDSAISTISTMQQSALDREKDHGNALALRDARVAEIREEVERVNASLKDAHATIMTLKRGNRDLTAQVKAEKQLCKTTIESLNGLTAQSQAIIMGYLNGDVSVRGSLHGSFHEISKGSSPIVVKPPPAQHMMRTGGLFDSASAKKVGKKRRRYDSGLGFLDEDEEEGTMAVEEQWTSC